MLTLVMSYKATLKQSANAKVRVITHYIFEDQNEDVI